MLPRAGAASASVDGIRAPSIVLVSNARSGSRRALRGTGALSIGTAGAWFGSARFATANHLRSQLAIGLGDLPVGLPPGHARGRLVRLLDCDGVWNRRVED